MTSSHSRWDSLSQREWILAKNERFHALDFCKNRITTINHDEQKFEDRRKKSVAHNNQPIHPLNSDCHVRFLDIYQEITKIATNDCVVRHFFCYFVVNLALTPNSHTSSSSPYRGRSIGVYRFCMRTLKMVAEVIKHSATMVKSSFLMSFECAVCSLIRRTKSFE